MRYQKRKGVPEEKRIKFSRHKNKIRLKNHAYKRYLERVGPIDRNDLEIWCNIQFNRQYQDSRIMSLIEFGGVCWGYDVSSDGYVYLTTCYGKGDIDMVKAITWEKVNNDRVNLKSLI
jgi:hypothetical protein